jgi:hypothetical protein
LENWIRYPVIGKPNLIKEGRLGQEIEVTIDPHGQTTEARNKRGVFYHELTCKEYPFAPKDSGADGWVFPLFLDHGVLDVRGNQVDSRPIKLFSNDYKRVLEIALPRRAVVPGNIYFSTYKNAYVMFGNTAPPSFSNTWGSWPKGIAQPIYVLSLDGQLSISGQIPWHDHFGQALLAFFTTRGVVYARSRPIQDKGLFLVDANGRLVRLISGPIIAGGVSPNGCKVSAAISTDDANKLGGVKVVDLCSGAKR